MAQPDALSPLWTGGLTNQQYGLLPLSMIGTHTDIVLPPLHDGFHVTRPSAQHHSPGPEALAAEERSRRTVLEDEEATRRAVLRAFRNDFLLQRPDRAATQSPRRVELGIPLDFLLLAIDMLATKETKARESQAIDEHLQRTELFMRARAELTTLQLDQEFRRTVPAPPAAPPPGKALRPAPPGLAAPVVPGRPAEAVLPPKEQRQHLPIGPEQEAALRALHRLQRDQDCARSDIGRQEATHRTLLVSRCGDGLRLLAAEAIQRSWRVAAAKQERWRRSAAHNLPAAAPEPPQRLPQRLFTESTVLTSQEPAVPLAPPPNPAASLEYREELLAQIELLTQQLAHQRAAIFAFVQQNFPTIFDIRPDNRVELYVYLLPTFELQRMLQFLVELQVRDLGGPPPPPPPPPAEPEPKPHTPPLPPAEPFSPSPPTAANTRPRQPRAAPYAQWASPSVVAASAADTPARPDPTAGNTCAQAYYYLFVADTSPQAKRQALAQFLRELPDAGLERVLEEVHRHAPFAVVTVGGVTHIETAALTDWVYERVAQLVLRILEADQPLGELRAQFELQRELEALRRDRQDFAESQRRWKEREETWRRDEERDLKRRLQEGERNRQTLLRRSDAADFREAEQRRRVQRMEAEAERVRREIAAQQQLEEHRRREWEARYGPKAPPPTHSTAQRSPRPPPPSLGGSLTATGRPRIVLEDEPPWTEPRTARPPPPSLPPLPPPPAPVAAKPAPSLVARQETLASSVAALRVELQIRVRSYLQQNFPYCLEPSGDGAIELDTALLRPEHLEVAQAYVDRLHERDRLGAAAV